MLRQKRSRWAVVGGVYQERCTRPDWDEVFGSGGRAASALAKMGVRTHLYAYADDATREAMAARAALEGFRFSPQKVERTVRFDYLHGLATPSITVGAERAPPIHVQDTHVVRFGMLEGDAVVDAEQAVYDPQDMRAPQSFAANGSKAQALAVVLNWLEAEKLVGLSNASPSVLARAVRKREAADVVVIKMGARGAFVSEGPKTAQIPAYRSERVWKIGSGDAFVAAFAHGWLNGRKAADSADFASRMTARFCETRTFAAPSDLASYEPIPHALSTKFRKSRQPVVYLAGPFFSLANLWIIQEVRTHLELMGLQVFSPYHDVGHGSADDVVSKDLDAISGADLVFAVGDGLDSGTMYEIGYARARGKPVVVYCENEPPEALKMMAGSTCDICDDFVTSIYRAFWTASSL